MNNVIKLKKFDPIIEKYLSSQDKFAVKKTLAFEYFSNDFNALNLYIEHHVYNSSYSAKTLEPKAQLEFTF